jgi:excisionase family DNA binding protein
MTAADLATASDVAAVLAEVRGLRGELAALAARLPSSWLSLKEAARVLGIDPRTCVAMIQRGQIIGRQAGRKWLVDGASLQPADPAEIATLARAARSA